MPKELNSDHIHEYVRIVNLDGTSDKKRYRCVHPDCHHWQYRNLLKNKRSICAICHTEEILLDGDALKRAKPCCFKCSNTKQAKQVRERLKEFETLFSTAAPQIEGEN